MEEKRSIAGWLALLVCVLVLQWAGGAWRADFAGHPDEAGHAVTGLMVRDYVAAGFPADPMGWARIYYSHYPKIALGHWPPLFYVLEGAWLLIFPPSRIALMVFAALWAATLAWLVQFEARRWMGAVWAWSAALVLVTLPEIQTSFGATMSDVACVAFQFAACLVLIRYLEAPSARRAALFGTLAGGAFLIKQSALPLAAVPLISVLMLRQPRAILNWRLWLGAGVTAVVAGPWYLFERMLMPGIDWGIWAGTRSGRVAFFIPRIDSVLGWPLMLAALVGIVWSLCRPRPAAAVMAALAVCTVALPFYVRAMQEPRHLMAACPAAVLLAAWALRDMLAAPRLQRAAPWVTAAALLVHSAATVRLAVQPELGLGRVAAQFAASDSLRQARMLISGSPQAEGSFITSTALAAGGQLRECVRADKLLAESTWRGDGYRPLVSTPAAVIDRIDQMGIDIVVAQRRAHSRPHEQLLLQAFSPPPPGWRGLDPVGNRELYVFVREKMSVNRPRLEVDPSQMRFGGKGRHADREATQPDR